MRNLKILFSYLGAYRRDAILGVMFVSVETALELFIPVIMANIIDVGVPTGDVNYMLLQGTCMLVCAAFSLVLGLGYARTSARVASGLGANLREAEYRKIQTLAFGNLDNYDASSLVTRMTTDITVIQNAIGNGFRPMVRGPVTLIVGLVYALVLSRPLATVFAIILPVLAIVLGVITYRVSPLYRQLQTSMDHLNGVVQEDLTAVRAVKRMCAPSTRKPSSIPSIPSSRTRRRRLLATLCSICRCFSCRCTWPPSPSCGSAGA